MCRQLRVYLYLTVVPFKNRIKYSERILSFLTAVIGTDRIQLCYLIFSHSCKLNRTRTLWPSSQLVRVVTNTCSTILTDFCHSFLLLTLIIVQTIIISHWLVILACPLSHSHFSLTRPTNPNPIPCFFSEPPPRHLKLLLFAHHYPPPTIFL